MKTKKKLLLLLSAVLLTATLITCFAIFSGAETVTPEMKITNCSLSFSDSVYIKYAVKTNVDDLKLLVWTEPQADYTVGTEKYTVTDHYSENISGVSHEIFDLKELSARMMTDNVYTRAYASVGGKDYYSGLNKYSILQYAYNKLGKTATASISETLKTLLADMLTYGASAQKHFNYKTARLASADWYQIKLTKGTLDDGFAFGLYLEGDKVTLTAPETDADGKIFEGWYNSADTKVASTNIATVTVGTKNEVYTPKYTTPSTPSYTEPTILMKNVTGSAGESVEVTLDMTCSPLLYGITISVEFDSNVLELTSATSGSGASEFTYTKPSRLRSGANFVWFSNDPIAMDGTMLNLVFKIKDGTAAGDYEINVVCDEHNSCDNNNEAVKAVFAGGHITVK